MSIDESTNRIIRERAYEIYEYHRDTGTHLICDALYNIRERTAEDDWIEAENEILKGGRGER